MAMLGVAGTAAGVGLAIVRERMDRRADARAMKEAADEQELIDSGAASESDAESEDANS
jgi:hypothetical protein